MNNLLYRLDSCISQLVNADKPKQRYARENNMELKYHKLSGWQLTHNGIIVGRFCTGAEACFHIQSLQANQV